MAVAGCFSTPDGLNYACYPQMNYGNRGLQPRTFGVGYFIQPELSFYRARVVEARGYGLLET